MDVNSKIELFKKGGLKNLYIISDFDETLTKTWNEDGTHACNSINVFQHNGYLGEEYVSKANAFFKKYRPLEERHDLSFEEKERYMIEWWSKHFDLLFEYGMSKDLIEEVVDKNLLHLRDSFSDFLNLISSLEIPFFIFSAGVGEVIKSYLKKFNFLDKDHVHVVSNTWNFDKEGKFLGIGEEIIHSLNKNQKIIYGSKLYEEIKNRRNIILMGDTIGDLNMANGSDLNNVLTIGFFNMKKEQENYDGNRKEFIDKYDIVIENDGSLKEVIAILNKIIN